ncbi:hypothetical protein NDU88_002280 [Pleurodeles waltl]|uniref:Uncharacterized protein n=1 Tax=Pleurodeles waltl TaxID=8319 RepID=A0AAV7TLD6_PLEWA|nr:hypothetical protein NDU88_002280 [Pleurodeles waltl]
MKGNDSIENYTRSFLLAWEYWRGVRKSCARVVAREEDERAAPMARCFSETAAASRPAQSREPCGGKGALFLRFNQLFRPLQ